MPSLFQNTRNKTKIKNKKVKRYQVQTVLNFGCEKNEDLYFLSSKQQRI